MRIAYDQPFTELEIEHFRQLIWSNIIQSMQLVIESIQEERFSLKEETTSTLIKPVLPSSLGWAVSVIERASSDLRDGEAFSLLYLSALRALSTDKTILAAINLGHTYNLEEKSVRKIPFKV